jgi:hypothetical protein
MGATCKGDYYYDSGVMFGMVPKSVASDMWEAPLWDEIRGSDKRVRVITDIAETGSITIQGIGYTNTQDRVRTLDGLVWIDGVYCAAVGGLGFGFGV